MSDYDADELEAIQAVVDRVSSYQDGATDGIVEKELASALGEAGLELEDADIAKLATAIEGLEEGDGSVQAADVLG